MIADTIDFDVAHALSAHATSALGLRSYVCCSCCVHSYISNGACYKSYKRELNQIMHDIVGQA